MPSREGGSTRKMDIESDIGTRNGRSTSFLSCLNFANVACSINNAIHVVHIILSLSTSNFYTIQILIPHSWWIPITLDVRDIV